MHIGLAVLGLLPMAFAQRQCYYPNGERDPNGQACGVDGGSQHTHCCYSGHYCLDNGLCFAKSSLTMYRSSCTDSTFVSDKCGQICTGGSQGGVDYSHSGVWTCGEDLFSCHSESCRVSNFTLAGAQMMYNDALEADVTALASTSGSLSTVTTTETVTSTAESGDGTTGGSSGGGVSTAAAAGIGAGVGVPLLIAAATLFFLLLRERKKRQASEAQLLQQGIATRYPPPDASVMQYQPVTGVVADRSAHQGKPESLPSEIMTNSQRYELHN